MAPHSGSSPRFVLFHDYITAAAIGHIKQLGGREKDYTHSEVLTRFPLIGCAEQSRASVGSGSSALLAMLLVPVCVCACVLHRSVGA